jgi:hypothetical protein
VTDRDGFAIGHGCARQARNQRSARPDPASDGLPVDEGLSASRSHAADRSPAGNTSAAADRSPPASHAAALAALPARVNLTISLTALRSLLQQDKISYLGRGRPARPSPWTLTPPDVPGPGTQGGPPTRTREEPDPAGQGNPDPADLTRDPVDCDADDSTDGFGTWVLGLPGGRRLIVELKPVPTHACDHRYESAGYMPSATLRHFVQVRDGECTFPSCSKHARESDFEHALPYDKGGMTCACNAGARSRQCHRVKQSAGWDVTQPKPGWHRWRAPDGRVYTQEPKRYPA